jgi:hypothetical protein
MNTVEKKVCMVIARFYPVMGGGEKQAQKLAKRIVERGIPVSVLTRNYSNCVPFEIVDGIRIYRMPLLGESRTIASSSYKKDKS